MRSREARVYPGLPLPHGAREVVSKRPPTQVQRANFSTSELKIEIDISKPGEGGIWMGDDNFWLKVEYEQVLKYCQYCCLHGHSESACYLKRML